ncbi:MAG: hypothetical protein HYV26_17215 [Candidatus Hydrogenedentes bacterium]|nr:hypothetical protein [Candidatus Hydrogenedentota bacterium]
MVRYRPPTLPEQPTKGMVLAKPNPQFEKRQRELAKKKKKEEKRLRKLERTAGTTAVENSVPPDRSTREEPAE